MPAIILTIAGWFGINPFRLIIYAALAVSVTVGALAVRQHYINKGYASAIAAVKKQDDRAVSAAEKVEKKAAACQDGVNGYWDVITQSCKLEDAP
jgi:hypothetical protein